MPWRRALTVLASAACCTLATGATTAGPASATATAATAPPAGHLGDAKPVPGLRALNAGGHAGVTDIRCPSPGFCTAVGDYTDGTDGGIGNHQAFVVSETDFTWGTARPVPGLASLSGGNATEITALACGTAGNCMIGGYYVDRRGNRQPFIAESVGFTWRSARPIFTVDDSQSPFEASVTALSCGTPGTSPGNCSIALSLPTAAGGDEQAHLVTEKDGILGPLRSVPGISDPGMTHISSIESMSCWGPGGCVAVGQVGEPGSQQPFLAVQLEGSWSAVSPFPGLDASNPSLIDFNPNATPQAEQVSCWGPQACTVGGTYFDHHLNQELWVADWVNGSWSPKTLPGSGEFNRGVGAGVVSLGCGAPGNCAMAGVFLTAPADDPSTLNQPFVDGRVGGEWGNAQEIDGVDPLLDSQARAAACPATGGCVTGGRFGDSGQAQNAFVAFQNMITGTSDFGRFNGAQEIAGNLNVGGNAEVSGISCSFAGECGFGGFYTDQKGNSQGFVADQSAVTATTLSATATTVAAGNEQDVHITATVSPFAGGTPTGTVTVLATGARVQKTVCTITLAGGRGDCTLPAGSLDPGTYSFFGNYAGDQQYGGSTASSGGGGGLTMHVVPAKLATSTALTVAPGKVAFGREQAAHLSVTVAGPSDDIPSGKVTIKAGSVTVGVITLAKGKGTTSLAASKLRPGSHQLTASYGGDPGNKASASGSKTLTVTPEPTSTTLTLSAASIKVGHEQAEHLTVQVRPQTSGSPAGKVTIRAGSATLCVITLKGARGSCTLTASKLRPGTYELTARYGGGTPYAASVSTKKTLTVTG